ncbi:MAG TPA: lytic transglycosylase domain-containing protein [Nitrospira sp.]
MAPTKMMKWGMSVHEVKWKVRVCCSFSRSIGLSVCFTVLLNVTSAPSTFGVEEMYRYISPNGTVHVTNVPSDRRFSPLANKRTYHASIRDQELEDAVGHYAEEYRLSPGLVMEVIKAESDFNPIVISKAGAVGLMQLIPETAIQHGVRNLYDTRDNIAGGARHLRYLVDRYHGNVRLALAAYNAGERKVDRYRQIPPYKETKAYVKKVMRFYRDYRMNPLKTAVGFDESRTFVR